MAAEAFSLLIAIKRQEVCSHFLQEKNVRKEKPPLYAKWCWTAANSVSGFLSNRMIVLMNSQQMIQKTGNKLSWWLRQWMLHSQQESISQRRKIFMKAQNGSCKCFNLARDTKVRFASTSFEWTWFQEIICQNRFRNEEALCHDRLRCIVSGFLMRCCGCGKWSA